MTTFQNILLLHPKIKRRKMKSKIAGIHSIYHLKILWQETWAMKILVLITLAYSPTQTKNELKFLHNIIYFVHNIPTAEVCICFFVSQYHGILLNWSWRFLKVLRQGRQCCCWRHHESDMAVFPKQVFFFILWWWRWWMDV